jgi:hypothetical protein
MRKERDGVDREKVIKGLEQCMMDTNREEFDTQCFNCPYFYPGCSVKECVEELRTDAIALLKAQEPVVMAGAELTDAELIEAIRKAPLILNPAVDAVPIIRCANCKWWNPGTLGVAHRCAALNIATTGEFYCAAAERKSNAYADQSGAEYADNPTV